MKKIPVEFEQRMQPLMLEEFDRFRAELNRPSHQGLRVNQLKIEPEVFKQLAPFKLEPIPWCPTGFYYGVEDRPGKHPYHAAGLYYIQEPSAMSVAEILDPEPGETILDLCAAPGGKTTQIAARMQGLGLLVSNEIHPARARVLSENVERCGIRHALVTNETPERLAERFPMFFDRILVDAPCSGEGMFRKLDDACDDWSPGKVKECTITQQNILDAAASMLKPGGTLVYSTCTFNPEENEEMITRFLHKHPEFELEPIEHRHGIAKGRPEWGGGESVLEGAARLWPHLLKGEGHFAARLRKLDGKEVVQGRKKEKNSASIADKQALKWFETFAEEHLDFPVMLGNFLSFGDQLYFIPEAFPSLEGLKVIRPGWHLGTVKKGRFEPSHALALGLPFDNVAKMENVVSFPSDSEEVLRYLKGEALLADTNHTGWAILCADSFPLGWVKISGGQLKNHYPKGLRWV